MATIAPMDERIKAFIAREKVFALSVIECDSNQNRIAANQGLRVYGASCYYAFFAHNLSLCFKSAVDSKHIQLARLNPNVSVIIAKDSRILGNIQGVQIQARFRDSTQEEESAYYTRFPFAKLGNGAVFALDIYFAKYTDNRLLLQKKLTYIKD